MRDRPNRAKVMAFLERRREGASIAGDTLAPLGEVLGADPLAEMLAGDPLLGDDGDDDAEDYSGLGDEFDAEHDEQNDTHDSATAERDAQVRMLCRFILDEPCAPIDAKLLSELAKALVIP